MKYSFDIEIDRINSDSIKWNYIQNAENFSILEKTDLYAGKNRVLPLWVADMDFLCPQPVIDAIVKRAQHGIFGYAGAGKYYKTAIVNWMKKRNNWTINPDWICTTPGVVPAINMLIQTFTNPGDKVIIQTPVYYPFFSAIKNNHCEVIQNPLINSNGRYEMDFNDLESKAKDGNVRVLILCNPHNPVGRVWRKEELERLGKICLDNNILVISDEIHSDLIFKRHRFIPFASVNNDFKNNSISCTAASKTFNLAGLHTSNIIVPNEALRSSFTRTILSNGLAGMNIFGVLATETAYTEGEDWLDQVMEYIEDNFIFLKNYITENIPEIKVTESEGTYLIWMDFRALNLTAEGLRNFNINKAGIFFDEGFIFGENGTGFERINIACPRSILEEALEKLKKAVIDLRHKFA